MKLLFYLIIVNLGISFKISTINNIKANKIYYNWFNKVSNRINTFDKKIIYENSYLKSLTLGIIQSSDFINKIDKENKSLYLLNAYNSDLAVITCDESNNCIFLNNIIINPDFKDVKSALLIQVINYFHIISKNRKLDFNYSKLDNYTKLDIDFLI